MLLMCKENSSIAEISAAVESRYGKQSDKKQKKLQIADEVLEEVRKAWQSSPDLPRKFCEQYQIVGYECDENKYQRIYLEAFLQQLKYQYRKQEKEGA